MNIFAGKNKKVQIEAEALYPTIFRILETYSNVHRGSGHFSRITTNAYEQAREVVREHLGLNKGQYEVIFCTSRRAEAIASQLNPSDYKAITSAEIGLSLGVTAIAGKRSALRKEIRSDTGGGTARLVSRDWVIHAKLPDKFEAGTPPIVNVIAFARALSLIRQKGNGAFRGPEEGKTTVGEILYRDDLEQFTGKILLQELRKSMIGQGILVPSASGETPFISLDNSASTPAFLPVYHSACLALSLPLVTREELYEEVRSVCAGFLNAPLKEFDVIFTSNTTESVNIVADSLIYHEGDDIEPVVVNTLLEHNSNDLPWRRVSGKSPLRVSIDEHGFIDLNQLETILCDYNRHHKYGKKRVKIVAVSGASNVLGVFNDLAEIGRIAHRYGALLLADAAQLVAHRKTDIETSGIDYFLFSGHKMYAPFGTGVLVARKGLLRYSPEEYSKIRLSGEENCAGIAALGKAMVLLRRVGMDAILQEEQEMTARLLKGMNQIPGIKIFGIRDPLASEFSKKGGVVAFAMKRTFAPGIAKQLAGRAGIGVRSGCHCSHILIKHLLKVTPGLERFQYLMISLFPQINLPGTARVSLGIQNHEEDVDAFIRTLDQIARKSKTPGKEIEKRIESYVRERIAKIYSYS